MISKTYTPSKKKNIHEYLRTGHRVTTQPKLYLIVKSHSFQFRNYAIYNMKYSIY